MRFSGSLIALIALTLTLALALPAAAQDQRRHITVTGEGRVEAAPDMATLSLGVTTLGATAAAALAANTDAMARVLAFLTAQGVEGRDIQTSGLSLNPNYDGGPPNADGSPVIRGYYAINSVTIRVRAMDKLGALMDAAVSEGANTFNGLTFGLQKTEELLDEARQRAVADARSRAEILAVAAGVKLGAVLSITEQSGYGIPIMMEDARFSKAGNVPVAGGEVVVSANVAVSFEIAE